MENLDDWSSLRTEKMNYSTLLETGTRPLENAEQQKSKSNKKIQKNENGELKHDDRLRKVYEGNR